MLAFIMEDLEDVALDHADKVRMASRLSFPLGLGLLGPLSQSSLVVSDLDPVTLAGTIQTGQSIEGLVE